MIGGRVLYCLASFWWGLSQSFMYRSGGLDGWFYFFLCIILFVVTSTYLARNYLWDVLGGASYVFIWYSPPLRAWIASFLLCYLCYSNETYVIVLLFLDWIQGLGCFGFFWQISIPPPFSFQAYLTFLFSLNYPGISFAWVWGEQLHMFNSFLFSLVLFVLGLVFITILLECYYRACSSWQYSVCSCSRIWPLYWFFLWFVGSVWCRPVVTGFFSLPLVWFLFSIAIRCFSTRDKGSGVHLCPWNWIDGTQLGVCYMLSSARILLWNLVVLYGWQKVEIVRKLQHFWLSVANSFEFWQPNPCLDLFWTHAVVAFTPWWFQIVFVVYVFVSGSLVLIFLYGVWRLVVLVFALRVLVQGSFSIPSLPSLLDLLGCWFLIEACWKLSPTGLCVTSLNVLWQPHACMVGLVVCDEGRTWRILSETFLITLQITFFNLRLFMVRGNQSMALSFLDSLLWHMFLLVALSLSCPDALYRCDSAFLCMDDTSFLRTDRHSVFCAPRQDFYGSLPSFEPIPEI